MTGLSAALGIGDKHLKYPKSFHTRYCKTLKLQGLLILPFKHEVQLQKALVIKLLSSLAHATLGAGGKSRYLAYGRQRKEGRKEMRRQH